MKTIHLNTPLIVELTLTKSCNHRCVHCYNPWRTEIIEQKSFSKNEIDIIVAELSSCKVQFVIITGGEPFFETPLLMYIVDKLNEHKIRFCINSNITLLNRNIIDELIDKGATSILTSLPSIYKDKFEQITQAKNSYSRFMENLNICIDKGINISINMVVSQNNINELSELKNFLLNYKIQGFSMSLVIPPSYDENNKNYYLKNQDILQMADFLISIKKELGISVNSLTPLPICILKDINKYKDIISATCSAGITVCTIDANGDLYACAHETQNYGNIFIDGLKACWDKMDDKRAALDLNSICKNCRYLGLCGGECRMITKNKQNSDYAIDNSIEIMFDSAEVPALNKTQKYIANTDIVLRKENFGGVVNIDFNNYFVSENILNFYSIISGLNSFTLSDIEAYIEFNEHFVSTFYYLTKINLIKELNTEDVNE